MAKKIYDIKPPKPAQKKEVVAGAPAVKKVSRQKSVAHPALNKVLSQNQKRKFPVREIVVAAAVILLLLCAVAYVKLPKADVEIWPKLDTLSFSENITADKSQPAPDVANKIIPAAYVQETKDGSQQFPATGSASNDGKASGTLKVYNKGTSAFTLVSGTHFLSDSGKYFVSLARIIVPAAKKGTPGSVDASVQAQEAGADYNIGPSAFSLPKLYGSQSYYTIYAQSFSPMVGGHVGRVKKVTDDDIQTAKDTLTKTLLQGAENSLRGKLGPGDVLLDGAIQRDVVNATSDQPSGSTVDTFTQKATVKVSALVIKKQDLEKFVADDISSKVGQDTDVLQKSIATQYSLQSCNLSRGSMALTVQVSAKTYYRVNQDDLTDLLPGKSNAEVKEVVDQLYGGKISQLKIDFWPFWVSSVPQDKKRISVKLNFE